MLSFIAGNIFLYDVVYALGQGWGMPGPWAVSKATTGGI